nr:hypothetical protein [Raoultibacter timonensis]
MDRLFERSCQSFTNSMVSTSGTPTLLRYEELMCPIWNPWNDHASCAAVSMPKATAPASAAARSAQQPAWPRPMTSTSQSYVSTMSLSGISLGGVLHEAVLSLAEAVEFAFVDDPSSDEGEHADKAPAPAIPNAPNPAPRIKLLLEIVPIRIPFCCCVLG